MENYLKILIKVTDLMNAYLLNVLSEKEAFLRIFRSFQNNNFRI